jgi:hypothetical protein
VDCTEDWPPGDYLDFPNAIGIFAPGPKVEFEYQGVRKPFTFGKIPYEKVADGTVPPHYLSDVFLTRIKAIRSWTDQQIEVKCERVGLERFGKFDDESRKLFLEGDGKMHVLVQYLITEGPKHIPNIEIFINGVLCENRRNRPPKDLRESTEYIVAKGAKGGEMSRIDPFSIFTPRSPIYHYGEWKSSTIVIGGKIDYNDSQQKIERALSKRIGYFRMNVTSQIEVDVSTVRQ